MPDRKSVFTETRVAADLLAGARLHASTQRTFAKISRRGFMQSAVATASSVATPQAGSREPTAAVLALTAEVPSTVLVQLRVNGKRHELYLEPRVTLLDALRENIGLTGSKKGCDRGQCGACTVLQNGRRINSCLTLAIMHEGDEIITVEGLAQPAPSDELSAVQDAFLKYDAFQCGYCTPGQICSATALLAELKAGHASAATGDLQAPDTLPSDAEIRERMSGNLCRCGAYPNIVAAIRSLTGISPE
jgi:xanthine dehydrogenase YagT iron-sulfur-binding subunit